MKRIRLAIFRDCAGAETMRHRLALAGIPSEVHDELRLARLWFATKAAAGVRLEVFDKAFERAKALVLEWDAEEDRWPDAIRCPECRSMLVDYPQFTRKSLFTNLAMGLIAALGLMEKEYYCELCHCMWTKKARPGRDRLHMAPNYFLEGLERPHPTAGQGATNPAGARASVTQ